MDSGAVGTVAMWGAVVAAGASLAVPVAVPVRARASLAALGLATVAVGALAWSLLTGNFALAYVADTTTRHGTWPYRLAGLWGGNGGSLLFWGWIILVAGVWATGRRPNARLVATVAGGSVVLLAAVAANPFRRLAIPAIDGGGLNPILQHPAMLYHPILLYAGHAGLAAPFALAVAGMATGRLDPAWWSAIRRWMIGAWLLLGVGLVAGAHWSYVELGWGGFWGWDPVENSGLLPWLAATAFLHAARKSTIDGDREVPVGVAVLAALPFCLSLLGAAVSRSGAAQSVHAFAEATAVGRGLAVLLVAAVGFVVVVSIRAGRRQPPGRAEPQSVALLGGVVLILAVALVVAVGTVFPVMAHAATGQTIDVTSRYYASVVTPLAVLGILLMGAAPSFGTRRRLRWVVAAAAGAVALMLLAGHGRTASMALGAAAAFAATVAVAELLRNRSLRRVGALMAHIGMAILLLGVGGSLLGRQSTQVIRPGGAMSLSGYMVHYRDVVVDQGTGWQRARTVLDITGGGQHAAVMLPGLRAFDGHATPLSDVAIRSTLGRDLIVAVKAIDPATHAAQLEVTVRPLVILVWWGGLLAAAGGAVVLAASFRQRRVKPAAPVVTAWAGDPPVSAPAGAQSWAAAKKEPRPGPGPA